MRRFIAPLVFLSLVVLSAFIHSQAQNLPTPSVGYTMTATQDPTHCTPGFTPLNWRQDLAALRYCSATDTWATLGSGGGSSVTVGAGVPAGTCTAGALYLRNDTVNSIQQFYVCGPTNTWQLSSYLTGSSAPTNCATGQIFLNTSSGTLSYCSTPGNPGTWTSLGGSGNVTAGATLTNNGCIAGGGTSAIQAVAGCSIDSSGNLSTAGGLTTGNGSSKTGYANMLGATSGGQGFTVGNTAGTETLYVLPSAPSSGNYLQDNGSTTCPTLPSGAPSSCEALTWAAPSGGGGASVQSGSVGSIGACTSSAFLYLITDAPYSSAYCNGSSSLTYFLATGQAVTPPSGTFAWTNQGSGTVTKQTGGVWSFAFPQHGATSNSINAYLAATPSVPFTQTYRFTSQSQTNANNVGIALQESGSGKLIIVALQGATDTADCGTGFSPCLQVYTVTSPTGTFASQAISTAFSQGSTFPIAVRVSVATGASGNITISYATNDSGVNFIQLYQSAKNTFFGTAPDHIGVFGNNNANLSPTSYLTLLSIN